MRTLHFWMLPDCGLMTHSTAREHLRDYLRAHPETKVEVTVKTASSLWRQLFLILKRPQENPLPDLIEIPEHWSRTLAQLGMLEDLAELAGGGPQRVSEPWWTEIGVLYFRKDVFRRLRWDPSKALATWDALAETCRKLAAAGGKLSPFANSNPRGSVSMLEIAPWIWSRGGAFFSKDGSRALFHREEAFYGIHGYLQLIDRGWMPLLGKNGLVPTSLFEGGSVLQFYGRLPPKGAPDALGAVNFPSGEQGRTGIMSSRHLALPRGAASAREAFGLLRYLTGPEQAARYAAAIGGFPCGEREQQEAFDAAGELGAAFRRAVPDSRPLPAVPFLGTLEKVFNRSMENLIRAIAHRSYGESVLRQELIYAAAEMDYVLSLSGLPS